MNDIDISTIQVNEGNLLNTLQQLSTYHQSKHTPNMTYGEPEEEGVEPKSVKVLTDEERLLKTLKDEVRRSRSVYDIINYKETQDKLYGRSTNERQYNYSLFLDKRLDIIFHPYNDANVFNNFINDVVITILSNEDLKYKSAQYTKEGLNKKIINIKNYIIEHLQLDPTNEIHKYFIKLVDKFCKYYQKQEQDIQQEQPISSLVFSQAQIYLQQELLEEDPTITLDNFKNNTIDELIEYHAYHTDDVEDPSAILELVRLVVIEYSTQLQSIPGLTPTADWHRVIANYYHLPLDDQETYFEDDEEFNQLAAQFNQDGILKQGADLYEQARTQGTTEGKSKGGKATKRNYTKSITIKNKETQDKHTFTMLGECMKFLNIPPATFSRFLIGKTKLNKKWEIVDIKTTKIQ